MSKPKKPEPTKSTSDIVRFGVQGEFWKVIESYLANELANISYGIIKKEWNGKSLTEAEVDGLRKNLDFVEWHLKLPQTILESYENDEPTVPDYDPYPHVGGDADRA